MGGSRVQGQPLPSHMRPYLKNQRNDRATLKHALLALRDPLIFAKSCSPTWPSDPKQVCLLKCDLLCSLAQCDHSQLFFPKQPRSVFTPQHTSLPDRPCPWPPVSSLQACLSCARMRGVLGPL